MKSAGGADENGADASSGKHDRKWMVAFAALGESNFCNVLTDLKETPLKQSCYMVDMSEELKPLLGHAKYATLQKVATKLMAESKANHVKEKLPQNVICITARAAVGKVSSTNLFSKPIGVEKADAALISSVFSVNLWYQQQSYKYIGNIG